MASSTSSIILLLAAGAIGVFVGVTMLSPLVAVPVTRIMGWPMAKTAGAAGHLAKQNAGRSPQRTATTAAALMIGLAVVSMTLTVGESVKAQFRTTLESSVRADYLAVHDSGDSFSTDAADGLVATGLVDDLTRFRYDRAEIGGVRQSMMGTDLAATEALFDLDISAGVAADPTVIDPLLVANEEAEAQGIEVGDVIPFRFESGAERDLTVIGIYDDNTVAEEYYMLDLSTWDAVGAAAGDTWLAISLIDGVTNDQADRAFAPIGDEYPQVGITTAGDYVESIADQIDQALAAVNVMVVLAVIIALIGIANTLALSVFERTRELGLLRAVGMTRRQVRRMIRLEAALVAIFGAALGVAVGVPSSAGRRWRPSRPPSPRPWPCPPCGPPSWCWSAWPGWPGLWRPGVRPGGPVKPGRPGCHRRLSRPNLASTRPRKGAVRARRPPSGAGLGRARRPETWRPMTARPTRLGRCGDRPSPRSSAGHWCQTSRRSRCSRAVTAAGARPRSSAMTRSGAGRGTRPGRPPRR